MSRLSDADLIEVFEALVDELEKPLPNETEVETLMTKLGLEYSRFPAERIAKVLEKMNSVIFEKRLRKDKNDSPEHS